MVNFIAENIFYIVILADILMVCDIIFSVVQKKLTKNYIQIKTRWIIIGSLTLGFFQVFLTFPIATRPGGNDIIVFCLLSLVMPLVGAIIIYNIDNVSSSFRKIVDSILFILLGVMMSFLFALIIISRFVMFNL